MLSMIPTAQAVTRQGLPDVCARHGKPSTVRYRFDVFTPIGPEFLLLIFGIVPFLAYRYVTRKTVTVGPWPFCADCLSQRKNTLIVGVAVGALSIAGSVVAIAVVNEPGLFLLGILLLAITTGVTLKLVSWPNLAKATFTENQQFVQVYAAVEFAMAVRSAPAVAAAPPPPPPSAPIPWFKPLKPIWIIALAIGLLGLVGGGFQLISGGPLCGPETMGKGDVCVTERASGGDTEASYDSKVAQMYLFTVAGALLTIVGGAMTAHNKIGNRRRHTAFVAAQK